MTFIKTLNTELAQKHLLLHPFYQLWSEGKLDRDILKLYAQEYYHHVAAFPCYISAIHSKCDDIKSRQVLLGNLREEEEGEENHPELWQRFAEGLGCNRNDFFSHNFRINNENNKNINILEKTKQLVQGYFHLVSESYATGLGALYAYERQTPEIAKAKIDGLIKFYELNDERSLKFFEVHMKADEWHSEECAALIEKLDSHQQLQAKFGAQRGAELLWQFLDGILEVWNFTEKKYVC